MRLSIHLGGVHQRDEVMIWLSLEEAQILILRVTAFCQNVLGDGTHRRKINAKL